MISVVYTSTAAASFEDGDLATLLMNSRANNRRLGLTGFLLHKDGYFLQTLEGPEDAVRDRLGIIAADPRHTAVTTLMEEKIPDRRFPAWSMGYEPVTDVLAEEIPGFRATFDDIGDRTPAESVVRLLLTWFQTRTVESA